MRGATLSSGKEAEWEDNAVDGEDVPSAMRHEATISYVLFHSLVYTAAKGK